MQGLPATINPRSAQRFCRDTMYQYFLKGREVCKIAAHASLALDGGRVSGDNLEVIAYYNGAADLAMWCPPQAGCVYICICVCIICICSCL